MASTALVTGRLWQGSPFAARRPFYGDVPAPIDQGAVYEAFFPRQRQINQKSATFNEYSNF
jgi:hypothetical protein